MGPGPIIHQLENFVESGHSCWDESRFKILNPLFNSNIDSFTAGIECGLIRSTGKPGIYFSLYIWAKCNRTCLGWEQIGSTTRLIGHNKGFREKIHEVLLALLKKTNC